MNEYGKLYDNLEKSFEGTFTVGEIKEIIGTALEVQNDTPLSTGKSLVLTNLLVKGEKTEGNPVDFEYPLNTGVNILIADNLKGKSSVFKMIKYALTGSNRIKKDVKKWIDSIAIGFKINNREYYIVLNTSNRVLEGRLYNGSISDYHDGHIYENEEIFYAIGEEDYSNKIQEFFFTQFSYYSLKWTQKDSKKGSIGLIEASASWKTYYKSIYLESKDSTKMIYGGQGKKVFQMLLGLELTYAINRLTILKEKYEFESALEGVKSSNLDNNKLREQLVSQLINVNEQLSSVQSELDEVDGIRKLFNAKDDLHIKLFNLTNQKFEFSKQYRLMGEKSEIVSNKRQSLKSEQNRLKREIGKIQRSINDINEYLEIGSFFSNLEIKHCPSCDKDVSSKPAKTGDSVLCPLCNEPKSNESELDKLKFEAKLEQHTSLLESLELEFSKTTSAISELDTIIATTNQDMSSIESRISSIDIERADKELETLNLEIQRLQSSKDPLIEKESDLKDDKAVLEYRINLLSEEFVSTEEQDIDKKINLINAAISELNATQYERSINILNKLENIMLEELHQFGLTSITEVKIAQNLDIKYKQGGEYIGFNDIAEGEQLRAKLAFYLGLIQLDISKNYGRHTRLLIIDSPNKEEGDTNYLAGLKEVLSNIEKRYSNSLQIVIGTATRELADVFKHQTVVEEGKYVF